jgi:hypothetical protein
MVRSARVQSVVKGDDAHLAHQILGEQALDAEVARAPVTIDTGDSAVCVYEAEDPADGVITVQATPVNPLPTSRLTVDMDPTQTVKLKSGEGRTVRVEIIRASGKKETHYLLEELDVFERGFPQAEPPVILP